MCHRTVRQCVRLAVARLAVFTSVVALGGGGLPLGCSPSPYRRALSELDRSAADRLADRLAEVSAAHRSALRHIERTGGLLAATASMGATPSRTNLDRCADAVDRCRWWMFNLERLSSSLDDLRTAALADVDADRDDEAQRVAADFRAVQQMMSAPVEAYTLALGAIRLSVEAHSSVQPHEAAPPDFAALREEVQRAIERAKALSATLRRQAGKEDDPATVSATHPVE